MLRFAKPMRDFLALFVRFLETDGFTPLAAFLRVLPVVLLVPPLGISKLPMAARMGFGAVLACALLPALRDPSLRTPHLWLEPIVALPVAASAAATLWGMSMAGHLMDQLRGGQESYPSPTSDERGGAFFWVVTTLGGFFFLSTGGPLRTAEALLVVPTAHAPWLTVARHLVAGVALATSLASPFLLASLLLETTLAFTARAASPAPIQALVAPIRSFSFTLLAAALSGGLVRVLAAHAP